jgi:glycosyltransferase involved in cell wall biosynthesis
MVTREPSTVKMRFSIIIPANNEEQMIGLCLEHLSRMDFPSDSFEVIVADNGSKDRTVEIARSWSDRLTLSVVEKPGVPISAVRNAGAVTAQGQLLAFLDADCLAPTHWLKTAEALLQESGSGIVGAHVRIPPDSTWVPRCWFDDEHSNVRGDASYVPSGNVLMSKAAFDRIGGFDESLETNEDYEICQRAKKFGYPVRTYPELEVIHLRTPQTLSGFYRKQKWHGMHVFRVFLENLPALYNARVVFFALYTLVGLLLVLAAIGAVAFGKSLWFLVAAIGFTVTPAVLLAAQATIKRRNAVIFAPLVLLYFLYGFARASCIAESAFKSKSGPREVPKQIANSKMAAS